MSRKSNLLVRKVQSVLLAAALAVSVVPAASMVTDPIIAEASTDSVRECLSENQKKIYDAYDYLDSRIKDKDTVITAANKSEYDSDGFYTLYTGLSEKKKYTNDELKFARRAFIYSHPTDIPTQMAQMKLIYSKDATGKYSCYAYLRRVGDNNYSNEKKQLKKAINKILKNVDVDGHYFTIEYECMQMVLDNVNYVKVGIDSLDLKNTAYGALVNHKGSAQGLALAFSALLDEADVPNDILCNNDTCWNQVKAGSKWYETYLVKCDKAKKGLIDYDFFNISQKQMKTEGYSRSNYCTNMRESNGTAKQTNKNMADYGDALLKDTQKLRLAVLSSDGNTTRTFFTSSETTANFVPAYAEGAEMTNMSSILRSAVITPIGGESAFTYTQWTEATPYFTITKNGTGASRTFRVTIVYYGLETTPVSYDVTINDVDNNIGKYVYKITGEDTVSLTKCTNKSIKNVSVPSTIAKGGKVYKVTKIEKNAFKKCTKLETVMLGSYVKEIGKSAFTGKTKLIRVETLGYELNKVGKDAFKSANENTLFLLRCTSNKKFNSLVKKIKKVGGKNSVYKYRRY
ncbi:leucine-rich repeat protein [Butyrivibrio sp. NC2002]|uniref:leucine-rich repeat protein n=1 Tax=Butyrivibrio sp. NC2002 TaxID=1410610 RepID=UPI00055D2473|nr:leucine-rich repeat protein [Butyrivibrio sp. NC2002]